MKKGGPTSRLLFAMAAATSLFIVIVVLMSAKQVWEKIARFDFEQTGSPQEISTWHFNSQAVTDWVVTKPAVISQQPGILTLNQEKAQNTPITVTIPFNHSLAPGRKRLWIALQASQTLSDAVTQYFSSQPNQNSIPHLVVNAQLKGTVEESNILTVSSDQTSTLSAKIPAALKSHMAGIGFVPLNNTRSTVYFNLPDLGSVAAEELTISFSPALPNTEITLSSLGFELQPLEQLSPNPNQSPSNQLYFETRAVQRLSNQVGAQQFVLENNAQLTPQPLWTLNGEVFRALPADHIHPGLKPVFAMTNGSDYLYSLDQKEQLKYEKLGYKKTTQPVFAAFPAANPKTQPVFQLFNQESGLHFYTTSTSERDFAINTLKYSLIKTAFFVPVP